MIDLPEDATELQAFDAADAWLRDNLPVDVLKQALDADWDAVDAFVDHPEHGPAWWAALGSSGLATPTWPREHGGLGLSPAAAGGVAEAVLQYRVGRRMTDFVGLALAGPTILAHGTPEQKARFLGPLPRAEHRVVPAVQRAGCGLRPRGALDPRRARRRQLGGQRAEGVDLVAHLADLGC